MGKIGLYIKSLANTVVLNIWWSRASPDVPELREKQALEIRRICKFG